MQLPVILFIVFSISEATKDTHTMKKRQIFREQVLPHAGGKIPDGAFRSDRLALNRLNAAGIAVPDGVLFEARNRDSHYTSHRDDPEIVKAIIKLVLKPDGRYAPPEGRYPFNDVIESTYIIRPPINIHHSIVPPQRPIETQLLIPAKPFFAQDDDTFSVNQVDANYDLLSTYNTDFPGARLWTGFGPFLHDNTNRIHRQAKKDLQRKAASVPNLNAIPYTGFKCPTSKRSPVMLPDLKTGCQVFHLCHVNGSKESFLCPPGMRFNTSDRQCTNWTKVPCPT